MTIQPLDDIKLAEIRAGDLTQKLNDMAQVCYASASIKMGDTLSGAAETIIALLARLDKAEAGWQDISTAPKDRKILGWGSQVGAYICVWRDDQWNKMDGGAKYQLGPSAITHWRYLPPPPAGA